MGGGNAVSVFWPYGSVRCSGVGLNYEAHLASAVSATLGAKWNVSV